MSKETQVIIGVSEDSPNIELWSTNTTSSITIGYDGTNSMFSVATGESLDTNPLLTINDSTSTFYNILSMNTNSIINVANPTNDNDVATKSYVDSNSAPDAGTGLTLSGDAYNVDASQTQITSVGALGSGSITGSFGDINIASTIITTGFVGSGTFLTTTGTCDNFTVSDSLNYGVNVSSANINDTPTMSIITLTGTSVTLDNGSNTGQIKIISAGSGFGSTNFSTVAGISGNPTVQFTAVGQSIILVWYGVEWFIVANNGTTIT